MGYLLNHIAKFAGESMRMRKTEKQEQNLSPEIQQKVDIVIQDAKNGNIEAMEVLGGMYFKGENVRYDPDEACYWWTEAANNGNVNCQYNLGLLYHGELSTMFYDPNLAGYWFNVAANNGDQEAYEMLTKHYRYSNFSQKWKRID